MYFVRDSRAPAVRNLSQSVKALGVEVVHARSTRRWRARTRFNVDDLLFFSSNSARSKTGRQDDTVAVGVGALGRSWLRVPRPLFLGSAPRPRDMLVLFSFPECEVAMHATSTQLKLNARLVPHQQHHGGDSAEFTGMQEAEIATSGRWQSRESVSRYKEARWISA